jgi:hypothetical protein
MIQPHEICILEEMCLEAPLAMLPGAQYSSRSQKEGNLSWPHMIVRSWNTDTESALLLSLWMYSINNQKETHILECWYLPSGVPRTALHITGDPVTYFLHHMDSVLTVLHTRRDHTGDRVSASIGFQGRCLLV